ncbi:MAG TPA: alanine racemase [Bosea sp. (in: a-proteobacteria)]
MDHVARNGTQVDATLRGVPVALPMPIEAFLSSGAAPHRGELSLPALTLDEAAFAGNMEFFFRYLKTHGAAVAPHAKTPMSPEIAAELRQAGAWGASVANVQQAAVLMQAGERRLLLANEIGGKMAGQRLGQLLAAHPATELFAFADSPAAVASLAIAAKVGGRTRLPVLVEIGAGRSGARDEAAVAAVIEAVLAAGPTLELRGVATYEGAVATADANATRAAIDGLMTRTAAALAAVRKVAPAAELICSAGGSAYFDLVVDALSPLVATDGNATLLLRSGAIFFSDHGIYARALSAVDSRGGLRVADETLSAAGGFRPALRLWAEVLSRPERGLAIAGFGMRDVSFDQGLPIVLSVYRDGTELSERQEGITVEKLNDQHAFLRLSGDGDIQVGDILCLGISHPCTCLDRWRAVFGLGPDRTAVRVLRTHFG